MKNILIKKILISLFLFPLFTQICQAQQLFKGGIVIGPNFSQIEGDDVAGFDKIGLSAGVLVSVDIKERWAASMEILYTQKGSASSFFNNQQFDSSFKIAHEYVEIPLVLNFMDVNGMNFGLGYAPARHIRSRYFELGVELEDFFEEVPVKQWEHNGIANLAYRANNFIHINLRLTLSLLPYQERFSVNRGRVVGQFNNTISLRLIFLMSALRERKK